MCRYSSSLCIVVSRQANIDLTQLVYCCNAASANVFLSFLDTVLADQKYVLWMYAGANDGASYGDAMQLSGRHLNTDHLPTITTQAELAPSTDSSSSRSRSDPWSSGPSTPTHPPTFQNMHHFQVCSFMLYFFHTLYSLPDT